MSNLLNESIIDAKALRASALKNAESVVIEKYADEVKKTLENLLEQDELPVMGGEPAADVGLDLTAGAPETGEVEAEADDVVQDESDEVPFAATDDLAGNEGENLGSFSAEGEDVEITLDLGSLQEAIEALSKEIDEDIEININEKAKGKYDDGDGKDEKCDYVDCEGEDSIDEEVEIGASAGEQSAKETEAEADEFKNSGLEEQLLDAVMEKLTADMGAELSGWAGRPTSQLKHEQEREFAHEASTESEDEGTLEEEQEELNESNENLEKILSENENLKGKLAEYQSALEELKENLYEVNLSNARLLYTNRVLRNSSLNERQKDKIVEAISGAGSVTEAKTIFQTLQSTVEAKPKKSPQSLSEAIGRRNTVLRATRKEEPASDPFQDRMKRLAGIK